MLVIGCPGNKNNKSDGHVQRVAMRNIQVAFHLMCCLSYSIAIIDSK